MNWAAFVCISEWIPSLFAELKHLRFATAGLASWACLAIVWMVQLSDAAEEQASPSSRYQDSFESPRPSWRVSVSAQGAQLRFQRRSQRIAHGGQQSEEIGIDVSRRGLQLYIEQEIPPAVVFDELTASLWVRCSRSEVRLGLRVVFPAHQDPQTGQPLTADLYGEAYDTPHRWQQLTCQTDRQSLSRFLVRVRSRYSDYLDGQPLNTQGMYVDRVVLFHELEPGAGQYFLDDLVVGPIISPNKKDSPRTVPSWEEPDEVPVTVGDDRIMLRGRPMVPLVIPYHGESLELIQQTACNLVWISDYGDASLLKALAEVGLGAMATPPAADVQPIAARQHGEETSSDYRVGLPAFTKESQNILFWNLGTSLPGEGLRDLRARAEAVRDADPLRRPIFIDVVNREREYARTADILGYSKHIIHTSTSPRDYVDFLEIKGRQSLRSRPTATWVQTEVSGANIDNRPSGATLPIVEPEQIWMQFYAALGSGIDMVGFWKQTPLDSEAPGADERLYALKIASLHARLLNRWVASGKVAEPSAPVRLSEHLSSQPSRKPSPFLSLWDQPAREEPPTPSVRAPVLYSESGWLILPNWIGENAQYQPGPMTTEVLRVLIRPKAIQAWEVTTTGIHPYQLRTIDDARGTEIQLHRFDQRAAIVVAQNPKLIEELKREAAAIRQPAGEAWVALATAKLKRVQSVHDELQELEPAPIRGADFVLAEARRELRRATQALESKNYDAARLSSRRVLRLTRDVQRAHWNLAARTLFSPVTTPYSISFQTLPDFWRFQRRLERGEAGENLLMGGGFENVATLNGPGWEWDRPDLGDRYWNTLELAPGGVSGRALRLATLPLGQEDLPAILPEPPIKMITAPIPVYSGQIMKITGQLWIETPPSAHPDGLLIFDSLTGRVGALRWRRDPPIKQWIPFELFRPVHHSGELRVIIELNGLGDVRIDDLQVRAIKTE